MRSLLLYLYIIPNCTDNTVRLSDQVFIRDHRSGAMFIGPVRSWMVDRRQDFTTKRFDTFNYSSLLFVPFQVFLKTVTRVGPFNYYHMNNRASAFKISEKSLHTYWITHRTLWVFSIINPNALTTTRWLHSQQYYNKLIAFVIVSCNINHKLLYNSTFIK